MFDYFVELALKGLIFLLINLQISFLGDSVSLNTFFQVKEDEKDKLEAFFERNHYVAGSYDDPSAFEKLNAEISKFETTERSDRIFYLALPPSVFIPVTQMLKDHCESKT